MNVKIDIDIAENILKAYARRNRDQLRVYGILLGTMEGKNSYHVQNCIFGFIYESKEIDGADDSQSVVQFKRLNDTIVNSIFTTYNTNFPNHVILGGFSTDKELFMELFYLYGTINEIESKTIINRNKILLLVDPYHQAEEKNEFGINVFNWDLQEENKIMSYRKVSHSLNDIKVSGSFLHSNLLNKEELVYHISHSSLQEKNLKAIIEEIKKSVDDELKVKSNTNDALNNVNLINVKKHLLLTERFMHVIENYLSKEKLDEEILHQVDYLLHELTSYFEKDEVFEFIHKEFRENQIIDSFTNLLNMQVRLTEKINKFNL